MLLLGGLSAILLVIGLLIGGKTGLAVGLGLALLLNFISYWFSDKIALKMYKARKVSKEEDPELHTMVEEICERSNCPKPEVYVIPTDVPNAFACGRNPKHAAVAVTEGIRKILNKEELMGVIAHEIGHITNRDILISTVAACVATAITYIALFARFGAMFGGMRGDRDNLLELLALAFLAPVIAMIIQFAISRSREYLADETAAKNMRNGNGLASALAKMQEATKHIGFKKTGTTRATAHMFIVNPFRGGSMLSIFSTHPPTNKRIEKLRGMTF